MTKNQSPRNNKIRMMDRLRKMPKSMVMSLHEVESIARLQRMRAPTLTNFLLIENRARTAMYDRFAIADSLIR